MTQTIESRSSLTGLKVLVVDDEHDIRVGLCRLISSLGASVSSAADGALALAGVEKDGADVVLTDLSMPNMSGAELLTALKADFPEVRVVILTGFGTIQSAVSCLQNGAAHFMTKPFDNQEVLSLIGRIGRQVLAGRRAKRVMPAGAPAIISEDPAMARIMELVERVAASPVPVLVEGESGTGKEIIARAIHERSALRNKPFLAVNAAALPDTLLESELFGHKRGAFTGADQDRDGIFVEAKGGTVFLDELSSMSPSFQGKLLRVLQEKLVRPLGSGRELSVDFRLITATNRDLQQLIRAGEFREDLYYRLGVMPIHLPPLRERRRDIAPLAELFLARAATTCLGPGAPLPELTVGALEALERHPWPGNVRELENAIQRAVVVCAGERILPHHLGLSDSSWGNREEPGEGEQDYAASKQAAIARFQREFVQRALEHEQGNVSRAAERCGLTRAALQRILRQLEIVPAEFKTG